MNNERVCRMCIVYRYAQTKLAAARLVSLTLLSKYLTLLFHEIFSINWLSRPSSASGSICIYKTNRYPPGYEVIVYHRIGCTLCTHTYTHRQLIEKLAFQQIELEIMIGDDQQISKQNKNSNKSHWHFIYVFFSFICSFFLLKFC